LQQGADALGQGLAIVPGCKGKAIGWRRAVLLGVPQDARGLASGAACACAAPAARSKTAR